MVFQPKRSYSWNENFGGFKVDANVVGGICEQIAEKEGAVTKENFLEASRSEESPTHCLFEWNDEVAAEKYRLTQSKQIIGCLRVTYINPEKEEIPVRAFINTSDYSETPRYESVDVALRNEDKREVYLKRIRNELDAFVKRNANIDELADILIETGMRLKNK